MAAVNDVDRGWAWMVLLASFGILVFVGSVVYGVGIIHVFLLETFEEDPVKTAWVGSLTSSLTALMGPLSGALASRTSCRVSIMAGGLLCLLGFGASSLVTDFNLLFLTYGVTVGIGTGLAYTPAVVVLGFYFKKRLDVACGLSMAGCGIGMITGPMIVRALTALYGWRGMFLMMGAINFHMCLFGALCFPSATELRQKVLRAAMMAEDLHQGRAQQLKIFRNVSFLVFCFSIFTYSFSSSTMFLHFPVYCLKQGATPQEVTVLLTIISICSITSRVLSGLATTGDPHTKYLLYFGSYGLCAVTMLSFPFYSSSFTGQSVFSALFGLYVTVCYVVLNPITIELVGLMELALAFGVEMLLCGLGFLLGPPVAAVLVESVGEYSASAFLSGGVMLLSAIFGMLVFVFKPPVEVSEIVIEETNLTNFSKPLEHIEPVEFLRSLASLPGIVGASMENLNLSTLSLPKTLSPLCNGDDPVKEST